MATKLRAKSPFVTIFEMQPNNMCILNFDFIRSNLTNNFYGKLAKEF